MGNQLLQLFQAKLPELNVLLVGLKNSGKTYFMMQALLDEDWGFEYQKNKDKEKPDLKLTASAQVNFTTPTPPPDIIGTKAILEPTLGFNREQFSFSEDPFVCWDVGGCYISESANGEFYGKGFDSGIKLFLSNIPF